MLAHRARPGLASGVDEDDRASLCQESFNVMRDGHKDLIRGGEGNLW